MKPLFIAIILSISFQSTANTKNANTDTLFRETIMERFVPYVAEKYSMQDSVVKRLRNHFLAYSQARSICQSCTGHCANLHKEFREGLARLFGKDIYDEYERFLKLIRQEIMLRRETEN